MQHSRTLYNKGLIRNKKMVTQSQFSQVCFVAQLENVKLFYSSLKAINFNDDANIMISENGLNVVVEEAKNVQASMYISRECFSEFRLQNADALEIRVNLTVVTDCLSVFAGADCSMKLLYKGSGAPLVLILEHHGEDDLITEVSIKTKNGFENLDFVIDENDDSFNRIIFRGGDFSNLLNEINKAAEELEIYMSPRSPYFRLTALGVVQAESNVEVAKTSDMFTTFSCQMMTTARYKMSHIRLAMKGLTVAMKVALKTDKSGLLEIQIKVLDEGAATINLVLFVTPLIAEDD